MAFANKTISSGSIWLPTGNPDTTNISATDFNSSGGQPGSLGQRFLGVSPTNVYQRAQLDSGATSANGVGVVAANMLAYWKDKSKYIVTNDFQQAGGGAAANSGFRNFVAGIFRTAVTAGNYCDVLQRGLSIPVNTTGAPAKGDLLVSDTTASKAQAVTVTAGTAATCTPIGVVTGPAVSNVTPCDVDIQGIQ